MDLCPPPVLEPGVNFHDWFERLWSSTDHFVAIHLWIAVLPLLRGPMKNHPVRHMVVGRKISHTRYACVVTSDHCFGHWMDSCIILSTPLTRGVFISAVVIAYLMSCCRNFILLLWWFYCKCAWTESFNCLLLMCRTVGWISKMDEWNVIYMTRFIIICASLFIIHVYSVYHYYIFDFSLILFSIFSTMSVDGNKFLC